MNFYVGLHQPSDAGHFERAFVSINRLARRRSGFPAQSWILDSGAFTAVAKHGGYTTLPADYAAQIRRWSEVGALEAAVAQDFMCEPFVLARTGKTVAEHQRLTIDRYDQLAACDTAGIYVMPVLQGFLPQDYVRHLEQYGPRFASGAWVGVGSVCKRNGGPTEVRAIFSAILAARPDLRLHGFGLKKNTLRDGGVRALLHSADSMAWSFEARSRRLAGDRSANANDWREAKRWVSQLMKAADPAPLPLFDGGLPQC